MNKKTLALTTEQYHDIINIMRTGFSGCRANNRVATALVIEANLGIRISDILKLRLSDVVRDGERYRLDITEQKTGKARTFTVLTELYNYIRQLFRYFVFSIYKTSFVYDCIVNYTVLREITLRIITLLRSLLLLYIPKSYYITFYFRGHFLDCACDALAYFLVALFQRV